MRKRRPASTRGAHQVVLTVRATVRRDALDELRGRLDAMGALARGTGGAGAPSMSWAEMDGVHFARLLLLEDSTDLDQRVIPASLLYMAELDAPLSRHTHQLADLGAAGLDATFSLCEGYPAQPDGEARREFLARHAIPSQANYVNTVGRTVEQIRREAALRTSVETFLDGSLELPDSPEGVRAAIQHFVRSQPSLEWATRRAPGPSLHWRAGEALHLAGITALLVAALPFALLVLPFYAVALRMQERHDAAPHVRPDPAHARRLSAIEDFAAQNQFSAVGYVKPGLLRKVTVAVVLWLIQQAARHVFTRADLSGVKTIHFAHWTMLDEGRRVLFTSNYDGSLESYMDDFIDKVAYGLNASFSNGVGFPRTKFLFFEGAKREHEFKDHLRTRQIPTQVYYSAYPELSARNVDNNAYLRSGLFGPLARTEVETWLRRL